MNKSFPVKVDLPIQWGDMDVFGHVNNLHYLRFFESARIVYFEKLAFYEGPVPSGVGPILAHQSCQYLQPVTYPDAVSAFTKVSKLGNTSFVMEFEIHSQKLGLVARGEGVIVCMDYAKGKKVSIPDDLRQKIERLEKNT